MITLTFHVDNRSFLITLDEKTRGVAKMYDKEGEILASMDINYSQFTIPFSGECYMIVKSYAKVGAYTLKKSVWEDVNTVYPQ